MELTIQKDLSVPMRDGVLLATDVYRPAGDGRFPVVMMRLPYNKEEPLLLSLAGDVLRIAKAGYAVVLQDCRGTWRAEGKFSPYFQEAQDGADAIAWAAAQEWSNGVVGMMGASYCGATQWLAATESPPALRAMAPFTTADHYYEKWTYQGGAFQLGFILQWACAAFAVADGVRRLMSGEGDLAGVGVAIAAADTVPARYWHTPLAELPALNGLGSYVDDWLAHPVYDDYWKAIAPCEHYDRIIVPALNFGGWFDLFLSGTLANYLAMKSRSQQRLVIGPWVHAYNGGVYAERNFGLMAHDSVADITAEQIRWFDHHLKGEANGVPGDKPVKIFVMGPNIWREEDDWPLPDTDWQRWHLHSNGCAGTMDNAGTLSRIEPGMEAPDSYLYDPRNPVPTCGGATFLPGLFVAANAGPRDRQALEQRSDVLCYTSEVLAEDLEVTGPVRLVLYVRSNCVDTDFTATLVDVHPDGRAFILTDGILRARYRESLADPMLMTPGEVYQLGIDLVATSNVFFKGHQIRLEVSSSNFPRFDRNTNTGGVIAQESEKDFRVALNEVLHDAEHISHVVLPVIHRT